LNGIAQKDLVGFGVHPPHRLTTNVVVLRGNTMKAAATELGSWKKWSKDNRGDNDRLLEAGSSNGVSAFDLRLC